ncbi:Uncharacterised protein [Gordonia paraffinivorans]|uniref:Uncharacterized protein n=1 Tax=Gordonia paraffinivorans TaxID=175628 RepID=A0ABD7UYP9_9ACTN|nr:Uncharacterised protein [Gordonia paraffinivorans]
MRWAGHDPRCGQRPQQSLVVERTNPAPRAGQQFGLGALGDDPAASDDDDVVGDDLDLVEQMRRQQHCAAAIGVVPQQGSHPVDARRVEAVGRLVEDEDLRVAQQRGRDTETLPHAEGVVADSSPGFFRCEADQFEHLVDTLGADAHGHGGQPQDLGAGPAGVLRRGVEEHADLGRRVGDGPVVDAVELRRARRGRGEPGDDPHGRRLAGAVRSEEAGDLTGPAGE